MASPAALRPARIPLLLALALLWGSNFLWIKLALRALAPGQVVFVRLTLGALVLLPILVKNRQEVRGATLWAHLGVAALLGCVIPYLLFALAEQRVDSSIAGIINATTPLWTVLIALAARHEAAPSPAKVVGIATGFAGAVIIFAPWQHGSQLMSRAGLECLGAAACYGISFVYMARFLIPRKVTPLTLSAGQLAASSVLSALTLPVLGRHAIHFRADALIAAAVLGVLGTGLAYVVNYQLIAESGASGTSVVTYLLPVVAIALGVSLQGDSLPAHVVLGMVVVLAGVALTRLRPRAPLAPT